MLIWCTTCQKFELWLSTGSVATYFRRGGIYYMGFVYNLFLFPRAQKFEKSVRFWQNYHHQLGGPLFETQCSLAKLLLTWWQCVSWHQTILPVPTTKSSWVFVDEIDMTLTSLPSTTVTTRQFFMLNSQRLSNNTSC